MCSRYGLLKEGPLKKGPRSSFPGKLLKLRSSKINFLAFWDNMFYHFFFLNSGVRLKPFPPWIPLDLPQTSDLFVQRFCFHISKIPDFNWLQKSVSYTNLHVCVCNFFLFFFLSKLLEYWLVTHHTICNSFALTIFGYLIFISICIFDIFFLLFLFSFVVKFRLRRYIPKTRDCSSPRISTRRSSCKVLRYASYFPSRSLC